MCNCCKCNEEDCDSKLLYWILAIIGAVVLIAGIAYAIYRFCRPDYLDDFDDEDLDEDEEEKTEAAVEVPPTEE